MSDKMKWTDAWQQLVYEHSPLRAVDVADFQRLLRQLGEFERLLLANTALTSYADELIPPGPSNPRPETEKESPEHLVRHVAAIQLQLMEDTFYSLRLDRHANAPDNRGWMNLFRRWAASPAFRAQVKKLEKTFSRRFIDFYYRYLEGWKEDVLVPHPWDVRADDRKRARGEPETEETETFSGITKESLQICRERADGPYKPKGIFLDPGLVEAGYQDSSDEPARVKPGEHGTSEPSPSSTPAPPPAGGEDSSKSTD